MPTTIQKGWLCIVGGFLTHVVTGAFYIWGNISINVSSYYKYNGHPDITTQTVSAVFPSIYFGLAIGQQLGIPLARKFGHKRVSVINMLLYCGSMYLATFSNFYFFVIFQGFLPGVFIGVEYLTPVDNAIVYFKNQKGLLYGLILCGFGFTPVVFNPIIQHFLNPNNVTPEKNGFYPQEVAKNLPFALRIMTTIYLVFGLLGALMMMEPSDEEKALQGEEQKSLLKPEQKEEAIELTSPWEILKQTKFYFTLVQVFCLTGFGFLMVSHYKEYGLEHIHDDSYFSIVGQVGGFANGIARFLWSFLLDYVDDKYLVLINIGMATLLSGTLNLIADSKALFMMWIVLIYLQYGGVYTLFPGICAKQFGTKYGPFAYNFAFVSIPFSNLLQFLLNLKLHQQFLNGQLFYIYVGINGFCFILQIINIGYVSKKKSQKVEAINLD